MISKDFHVVIVDFNTARIGSDQCTGINGTRGACRPSLHLSLFLSRHVLPSLLPGFPRLLSLRSVGLSAPSPNRSFSFCPQGTWRPK